MFWKKSIFIKLLLGIILPVFIIFGASAWIILQEVGKNIEAITLDKVMTHSQAASYQVEGFFTRYLGMVHQIGNNDAVVQMLKDTHAPGTTQAAPSYGMAMRSLERVLAGEDSVSLVWTADFDSGDSVHPGGVVQGRHTNYQIDECFWYPQALDQSQAFVTEPYENANTGKPVVSVIQPVFDGGSKIGVVAIDLSVEQLKTMMSSLTLGKTGFYVLATPQNNLVYHPNPNQIGQNISQLNISGHIKEAFAQNAQGAYSYQSTEAPVKGYLSVVEQSGWKVLSCLPDKEFYQGYYAIQKQILLIFTAGLLVMLGVILIISIGIIRPLKALRNRANSIANGDLNITIDLNSADEVGQVALALSRTVDRLRDYISYIRELSTALNQIAQGELHYQLSLDYVGEFSRLKEALNNISASLNTTLGQINTAAEQVAMGSHQVAAGAQALSQGAIEQASTIEELSINIAEISEQIKESAQNAQQVRKESVNTHNLVENSNLQMQEMIQAIEEISIKSTEISKIIKTIDDIAFQTNILALNAAVEAARAGAAGKGFAVVADEVRNLAGKSAKAAKNTTQLIEETVNAVRNGTRLADATAAAMQSVVEGASIINNLIDNISLTAVEQANAIEQIRVGAEQIAEVVQTNSATAEESAAASEELSGQASIMKELVSQFHLQQDTPYSSSEGKPPSFGVMEIGKY